LIHSGKHFIEKFIAYKPVAFPRILLFLLFQLSTFPPLGQEGAGEIVHNILKNSRPDPATIIKTT